VKATIRIRPSSGVAGERPAPEEMRRAAELLQQSGFEVLRVGRFGVNVEGDEHAFQRELGVHAEGGSLVAAPQVQQHELSELIDLVEVAGKPERFNEN
jgi:hypothetical protein